MAGNISNLSLTQLKSKINAYEKANQKLYEDYLDVYNSMEKLRTYWTGKRINMLLENFNTYNKDMFAGVQYFTDTVYNVLDEVYNQYSKMETGKPANVTRSRGMGTMDKIALTDANKIKFDLTKVTSLSKTIQSKLSSVSTDLKNIVDDLDGISAYSDSLKTISNNYKTTASNLKKTMDKLKGEMTSALEKAIQDVKSTESYNESDAKKLNTTTKK